MQFSLLKPLTFTAFFTSFAYIPKDEDMQFSQPLQSIGPSFSPLTHSFFHKIPARGICIYIYNNILFIKTHPHSSAAFALEQTVLGWKAVPVFFHHLKP